jgi:hypothetical protein
MMKQNYIYFSLEKIKLILTVYKIIGLFLRYDVCEICKMISSNQVENK